MEKEFDINIKVTTKANVSGDQVVQLLRRLIDSGLADAQQTLESGEGDLEAADLASYLNIHAPVVAPTETSVKVKHWNREISDGKEATHQFDIDDQRKTSGQAYITLGALEGSLDDLLSVTMEVHSNPLTDIEHVPCAHVHFDSDALAVSLFKIGDKILVRPETNVAIEPFNGKVYGIAEKLYWIS